MKIKVIFNKISKLDIKKRALISIALTNFIAFLLTLLGIYGFNKYGIAMFIVTPFFIGLSSSIMFGLNNEVSYKKALFIGILTLITFSLGLIVFAIEGLICITMAAPLSIILNLFGSFMGIWIFKKNAKYSSHSIIFLVFFIPTTSFFEKNNDVSLNSVKTSIEINASTQSVWKNVIEFPKLEEPDEFIFQTGIAYPIDATIDGTGVGAIRYCNFTTGSFVEPITIWDEPRLLKFDVKEQPKPMTELSFWDIDAPHLHDYFVSKQGQFKITKLPNNRTRLEGTTWYYHNIRPSLYWKIWSDFIIHKIHSRVLNHIKSNAEKNERTQLK